MANPLVPFSPRSGSLPDFLLGRDSAIAAIKANLANPLHDENGNLLFVGLRGIGKTVMLTEAGRLAREQGWLVIDSYLTEEGLLRRLNQALNAHMGPAKKTRSTFSFSIAPVKADRTVGVDEPNLNLVNRLEQAISTTNAPGILITIDEVHATAGKAQSELREYGNEIQLAHRMGLPVMSIMAGLPGGISALLKDQDSDNKRTGATFLRRAAKETLGPIDSDDVWNAYSQAASMAGKLISAEVLDLLTESAKGYPYLFQLIGQRVWNTARKVITEDIAVSGIKSAIRRLGSAVLDTSLNDLSSLDKSFLLAMAQDDQISKMQDIAARMMISPSQASNYKNRLVTAEMIMGDHGYADFAMPYMREYLREHYASTVRFAERRK